MAISRSGRWSAGILNNGMLTTFFTVALTAFMLFGWGNPAAVLADSAGPNVPTAASGTNWTTPANVYSQDTVYASFGSTAQNWLVIGGYGFSIPPEATITGVTATVWGYGTGATNQRRQIKAALTTDGIAPAGTAKTAIQLAAANGMITQGGDADTWGAALTPAAVNGAGFGIMIADNDASNNALFLDYVALTVTYTIDTTPPVISAISPPSDSYRNNAVVGYTLSERVTSGSVTFTRTGGSDDPASPHLYTLSTDDMSAGSHSVNTGKPLVNGAVYSVSFDAMDAAANAADQVTATNIRYDTSVTALTLSTPAAGSRVNNARVDYSLNEPISAGQIFFIWTGGTADAFSPHIYDLSGAQLTSGAHTAVDTGFTLVDGAVYAVSITNVLDLAGNDSDTVENTSITFDSTAVAFSNTAPAAGSAIRTSLVSYTLSEQAASGSVTFTRTGGSDDSESPHSFPLVGDNLTAGSHTDVVSGVALVDGAIYTVSFNAVDLATNPATTVSNALVIFDTTAPTDGVLTAAAASASQINLSWTAASDSGSGLAAANRYKIVRADGTTAPADCSLGTQVYLGNGTTYNDTGRAEITDYAYRLCAYDASGNVSSGSAASARTNDGSAPTVTAFTMPAAAASLVVAVSSFTAGDNVAVTGYLINESETPPAAGAAGWSATVPTIYTFSGNGTKTAYAWARDAAGNVSTGIVSATVVITTTATLSITTAGTGIGTVNSSPGGIACESGVSTDCSAVFSNGTPITLTALPDWKSVFISWTVGCVGTNLTCDLTLDGDSGVTATFNYKPLVMLPGPTYYATIQDAYSAASDSSIIKMRDQTFTEGLDLNRNIGVTLDGGYDAAWLQTGYTTLTGSLSVSLGAVTINSLIVQ